MVTLELRERQRERLRKTIEWAARIRAELQPLLDAHGDRVHFRPSSTGIAMVGLLPDRPQRGKSGITDLKGLANDFEALFDVHCRNVAQGRITSEKALQSFLISEAQAAGRRLASLSVASGTTNDPVELVFITDELSLPVETGKRVCDILALRRDGDRCIPVLIELKSSRHLTRLVEQLDAYATLIDQHPALFARLFSALLGERIRLDGPAEKWIVWPAAGAVTDPKTEWLLERRIRVVGYSWDGERYTLQVGPRAAAAAVIPRAEAIQTVKLASTTDSRITNLRSIGGGEGYGSESGLFEGKPAFIVDCGGMNSFLDEEDWLTDTVTVLVFESETVRDRYIDEQRRESATEYDAPAWEKKFPKFELDQSARVRGCLLGGAVGDALGAPIEFMSLAEIRRSLGPDGIQEFAPAYGRVGAVTDDTQMTLFTAEGLIRAHVRSSGGAICHPPGVIHHALLRWLLTQGETSPAFPKGDKAWPDGWLVQCPELFSRRAPGTTCLSALKSSARFGDEARNDSKGCGAIMRIAPIGLFVPIDDERSEAASEGPSEGPSPGAPPLAYEMACESAKTTHGHIASTLSSGFFALVIARLLKGATLSDAVNTSKVWVGSTEGSQEVMAAIEGAIAMASSDAASTPETVERLGAGWVAEEALGISLFCALRAESFEHGVRLAVNHGGDSDSTGSLTGQLLGTLLGADAIPSRWLDQVELREVIDELARDLVGVTDRAPTSEVDSYWKRYPGW